MRGGASNQEAQETPRLTLQELHGSSEALSVTSAGKPRIPRQLILMSPHNLTSIDDLSPIVRSNIERILSREPEMRLRLLDDFKCFRYLARHSPEFYSIFNREKLGSHRGDICRTAVLFQEGGFYMDLDMDLFVPFNELVDSTTSFMSAYDSPDEQNKSILNAVIGVEPRSLVMSRTLQQIRKFYTEQPPSSWNSSQFHMGPWTLGNALDEVLADDCPHESMAARKSQLMMPDVALQWNCGPHVLRLYVQRRLNCNGTAPLDTVECPGARLNASYEGLHFGLFKPGPKRHLIGFPHSEWCDVGGCNLGGHSKGFWTTMRQTQRDNVTQARIARMQRRRNLNRWQAKLKTKIYKKARALHDTKKG